MTPDVVSDPDGVRVELTDERWTHILQAHVELKQYRQAVLEAVCAPTRRLGGRAANEEWFLVERVGPSRSLQVVVAYGADRGWIVTAFARRSPPRHQP